MIPVVAYVGRVNHIQLSLLSVPGNGTKFRGDPHVTRPGMVEPIAWRNSQLGCNPVQKLQCAKGRVDLYLKIEAMKGCPKEGVLSQLLWSMLVDSLLCEQQNVPIQ